MASEILDDLRWRGLLALSTDEAALSGALSAGPITFYCGFDPTAPSLHFGNLVQLVTMRRLQEGGHHPIAVVGGATGLVGDPSGKSAERALNVLEAQFQNAVRLQINNLYTAYVDVLAARETVRFAQASAAGLDKVLAVTDTLYKRALATWKKPSGPITPMSRNR